MNVPPFFSIKRHSTFYESCSHSFSFIISLFRSTSPTPLHPHVHWLRKGQFCRLLTATSNKGVTQPWKDDLQRYRKCLLESDVIHINLYDLDSGVIAAQHLDQSSCSSSIEESCHQLCHQLPPAATSCPQLPPALATSFTTSSSISLESEQRRSYELSFQLRPEEEC